MCEGLPSEVSLVESVQEFIPLLLLRCETTGPILECAKSNDQQAVKERQELSK